jgi:hypothetical protein
MTTAPKRARLLAVNTVVASLVSTSMDTDLKRSESDFWATGMDASWVGVERLV